MTVRLATALAVIVLALVGCGGGSGDDGQAPDGATSGAGPVPGGATAAEPEAPEGGDERQKLDPLADQEPVPERSVPPDQRSGERPRYTPRKPVRKARLKPNERLVYEQSQYLCERLGVEGMSREYRIESTDPETVARAVAARTYQPEARDAVYWGCLAGLR